MPAPFEALARGASTIVDNLFAEQIEVHPRLGGDSRNRSGPDHSRPIVTIEAILDVSNSMTDRGALQGGSWGGEMPADHAMLHVQHDKAPPFEFQDGDRIRALDRPGKPYFEVFRIDRGQIGGLVLRVTPL